MQVLAVGLPLCATTTLKEVFEEPTLLNIGPTMHMNRCLPFTSKLALHLGGFEGDRHTEKTRHIVQALRRLCCDHRIPRSPLRKRSYRDVA